MQELWKEVPYASGYAVSNLGYAAGYEQALKDHPTRS